MGLVTEKNTLASGGSYNLDDEGMLINHLSYLEHVIIVFILETEGVVLNSLSRAELMAKLAARDPSDEHDAPRRVVPAPIAP